MDISRNFQWDGWLEEEDIVEYDETEGFVDHTDLQRRDCEILWGQWAIDRIRVAPYDYDFSKHPQVIADKIAQILQEKFDRFVNSQEIRMGKDITCNTFPEFRWKMWDKRLLFEQGMNWVLYWYVQIFWQIICLWAVIKSVKRWWTSQAKMWQVGAKIIYEYTINSAIIWRKTWVWWNNEEAVKDLVTQIYDMFSRISPEDFPQAEEEIDYDNAVLQWSIDGSKYTVKSLKDSEDDICLEFEYDGHTYITTDMKFETFGGKRKIYFLLPNESDKKTENAFRKRMWAEWRNFEIRVQRLMKNIIKILKWQKQQDREIIEYLNSLKQ